MTNFDDRLVWCAGQVAMLAALGMIAMRLFVRRSPAAVAMIVVCTVAAPAPLPRIQFLEARVQDLALHEREAPSRGAAKVAAGDRGGPAFDVQELARRALALMGGGARRRALSESPTALAALAVSIIGASIGCVRLAMSVRHVARIHGSRRPIADAELLKTAADLRKALRIRRAVALCESSDITSPAVVGWRRPVVLLPAPWSEWSADELRTAVAHELAHVARGDYPWRLVARAVEAVHFYHPLIHWLTRRFLFVQELATDRAAAAVVGGSATYLRALSELALRLDEPSRLRVEPLVLPALSSNLMRRIAMLRSTEGSRRLAHGRLGGLVAAALIGVIGAGTLALRGSADSVEAGVAAGAPAELFARAPFEDTTLGDPRDGRFVVRVAELLRIPVFAAPIETVAESCRGRWREAFGVEAPHLDFSAIEYVAGVIQLTIEPMNPAENSEHTGRMMIGTCELVVRFVDDVDWKSWFKTNMPAAELKSEDGLDYVVLPVIKALGPAPGTYCVAARDSRTLVLAWTVERLRTLAAARDDSHTSAGAAEWSALDGGLVTFLANDGKVDRELKTPKAVECEAILKHVERYGAAFDLDPATNEAGLRLDFHCANTAAAAEVRDALAALMPQLQTEAARQLAELPADPSEAPQPNAGDALDRGYLVFWQRMVAGATTTIESNADGSSRVRVAVKAPFPEMFGGRRVVDAGDESETMRR